ncbi:hypothetical protein UFOVP1004_33 [uncultured Caudovirales phage]|uniref:Uncharacterized protein n=1 Tax=uncultured Caudovirales phage TaxID=2100421 RepID=A0A6J5Q393_9CAUD|nr:hypothetical protein UFOVP1004_33 [uncultured Caudovirales phage]
MAVVVGKSDSEIAALAPVQSVSGRTGVVSTANIAADLSLSSYALRSYVDGVLSSVVTFTGTTDCSANPNYPAATIGDAYVVSVSGKIGGASGAVVSPGDVFIANVTNGGGTQAAVGGSWTVVGHTLAGALLASNNLSDVASTSTARTNLGLGSIATQAASAVSITGGSVAGISDLAVADGGTGASTAAAARANLGLVIGTDVLSPAGSGAALTGITSGQVSGLGTMATQAASAVSITGGSIAGITDLAVADGGTGASTAAAARTNLGLVIGTDVLAPAGSGAALTGLTTSQVSGLDASLAAKQPLNATLTSLAASTAPTNLTRAGNAPAATTGQMLYAVDANTFGVVASQAYGRSLLNSAGASASRTTLGLNTMATQAANNVAITGGSVAGIADLAVADGGTGASTAAAARTNLGLVIGTDVLSPTGNGSGLTGITAAQITGLGGSGSMGSQDASAVAITGGTITGITDLAVADGGTGASTAAAARTNLGLVIGTDVLAPTGSGSGLAGITSSQVGLGSVTNDAQTKAAIVPNTVPTAGQLHVGNAGGTAFGVVSASGDATISATGAITLANGAGTRTNLGLGSIATQAAASVAITGGTISGAAVTGLSAPSASGDAATKGYVDGLVSSPMNFKGATDCSTNPNYPAATIGDTYVVSVAGKIGGASGTAVDIGDLYLAKSTNAGGTQAAVGASWAVIEHNLQGALLSANNLSDVASASTALGNLGGQAASGNLTATITTATPTNLAAGVLASNGTDVDVVATGAANRMFGTNGSGVLGFYPVTSGYISGGQINNSQMTTGTLLNSSINAAANIDATKLGTGAVDNTKFNYLSNGTEDVQTRLNSLKVETTGIHDTAPIVGVIYLDQKAQVARTINGLYGLKTTSGTCTLSVKINGTAVTGLSALSVTSTSQDAVATAANTVAAGDIVTLEYTAVSSPVDMRATLKATRT